MEIDTKRFTVMIVGFAVAIILVSGLMVPVISSLGSNDGGSGYTNTGETKFANANGTEIIGISLNFTESYIASLSITKNDDVVYQIEKDMSNIPEEYDLDTLYNEYIAFGEEWVLKFHVFCNNEENKLLSYEIYIDGTENILDNVSDMPYGEINPGESYNITVSISSDFTFIWENDNFSLPNVIGIIPKSGENDWVFCEKPVIDIDTVILPVYVEIDGDYVYTSISGLGTWENITWYYSPPSSTYTYNSTPYNDLIKIDMISKRYIGNNSQETIIEYTYFIVPAQIGDGGGSGSGISPTLMSLISIIPLITVVGIVLGAITIIRRN